MGRSPWSRARLPGRDERLPGDPDLDVRFGAQPGAERLRLPGSTSTGRTRSRSWTVPEGQSEAFLLVQRVRGAAVHREGQLHDALTRRPRVRTRAKGQHGSQDNHATADPRGGRARAAGGGGGGGAPPRRGGGPARAARPPPGRAGGGGRPGARRPRAAGAPPGPPGRARRARRRALGAACAARRATHAATGVTNEPAPAQRWWPRRLGIRTARRVPARREQRGAGCGSRIIRFTPPRRRRSARRPRRRGDPRWPIPAYSRRTPPAGARGPAGRGPGPRSTGSPSHPAGPAARPGLPPRRRRRTCKSSSRLSRPVPGRGEAAAPGAARSPAGICRAVATAPEHARP